MKKTVLVVMVVLLAAIMLPLTAEASNGRNSYIRDRNGAVVAASGNGFAGMVDRNGRQLSAYEYANGRPDPNDCSRGRGGSSNSGYSNRGGGNSANEYYDDGYGNRGGYDRRGSGNRSQTGINVGLGTRIGGVNVNLGYSKTTYSKPKTSSQKPPVIIVNNPPVVTTPKPTPTTEKCRMTLVQEVGDQLETISDIIVTNPEKELVQGKRIVFKRNGQFFAEYVVDKVSGDSVFVETVDAPRGNPRPGDSFEIDPEPEDINTVD